jgi:hypothetical protein
VTCCREGKVWSAHRVKLFMAWAASHCKAATIESTLTAIKDWHKSKGVAYMQEGYKLKRVMGPCEHQHLVIDPEIDELRNNTRRRGLWILVSIST